MQDTDPTNPPSLLNRGITRRELILAIYSQECDKPDKQRYLDRLIEQEGIANHYHWICRILTAIAAIITALAVWNRG